MYRILKHFVKKPEHLRVLRHVFFGVPAEHPASEDFRNSLLKGEVPKNIAEMEGDATEKIPMKRDTVDAALRRKGKSATLLGEVSSCEQAAPAVPDDFDKSG